MDCLRPSPGLQGYSVQLCEREPYIGGILRKYLPQDILQEELEREFRYAPYSLVLNCEISSLDQVSADAIYIATGAGGDKFGLDFTSNVEGVF